MRVPRLALAGLLPAVALSHAAGDEFSVALRGQWAVAIDGGETQSLEMDLEPEWVRRFDNGWRLTASGRLRVQNQAGLRPGDMQTAGYSPLTRPWRISDTAEFTPREFYLQGERGGTYLTLGKQQIVWGKADGLKVLDRVNPQSFREFILEDFEDSRIPLWAVNVERPLGDWDAQLVWLPDTSVHALPGRGARYAFSAPMLVPSVPPGVRVDPREARRPGRVIADSDIGLRLSRFWNGWDISLNYLYQYDDFPVLYQQPGVSETGPRVTITPRYERTHVLGGSFSNAFGDWVLRGEAAWFSDRYFLADLARQTNGIAQAGELSSVLGLDWSGIRDSFISVQLFQSRVLGGAEGMLRDRIETTLTLLLRRDFNNDTLHAQTLWLAGTNRGDGLLRFKLSYDWRDELRVWLGADVFYGDSEGLYGQFDDNDRVLVGVEVGVN